ncbi:MAG: hypothetical protein ACUVX8_14280 [Candidatus Zipacnadales bacterium]
MKRISYHILSFSATLVGLTLLVGCGGGGGGERRQADVAIQATVTAHSAEVPATPNVIDSVIVTTTDAGDTIDIANASARIERADGTSTNVPLHINATNTQVTMGSATVSPSATEFNTLVIRGPIRFIDGNSGTATTIGRVEFKFEVLANGEIVSPETLSVHIPTSGAATDRRIRCTGLSADPPDYVKTIILDNQGGITESAVHAANAQGNVVIHDAQGSITAEVLSGNNSRISALFARTDSDSDGMPELFE